MVEQFTDVIEIEFLPICQLRQMLKWTRLAQCIMGVSYFM